MPYSVYLVDDHPIILRSLHDVIEAGGGHKIIGETGDIEVAKNEIPFQKPEIAIIDLNLNGGSGLDLIKYLHERIPQTGIVVYSMRDNIQTISAAYKAGANAYIPKSEDPMQLLPAIESAAAGERFFLPGIAERVAEYHALGNDPAMKLTEREFEIFMAVARGRTVEQISAAFNIGNASILNRLSTIRSKLDLNNQVEFALLAMKHGYITPETI